MFFAQKKFRSEIAVVRKAKKGDIIRVSFSGYYPPGSAGNDIAAKMESIVADAVQEFHTVAVIFDLSRLNYVWGDAIGGIFSPLFRKDSNMPSCVVARGRTARALCALIEPAWLPGIAKPRLFAKPEEAMKHLESQAKIQEETDTDLAKP